MTTRPLIVVTDYLAESGPETKVIEGLGELKLLQTSDEMEVARRGADADILLVFHDIKLTEKSISHLGKCKAIIRCGVGVDNVDIKAAGSRGIVVCNVPDYGTEEVADHALMMLLAIARRLVAADQSVKAGQ
jgi:lactate dehydrogenase-like 2-hydroxyacid dehydrogenase